jgi:hypothetical protein
MRRESDCAVAGGGWAASPTKGLFGRGALTVAPRRDCYGLRDCSACERACSVRPLL